MTPFKSIYPEHFIFKRNNLITNAHISLWVHLFSVEEGGGISLDEMGYGVYGVTLSTCKEVKRVCNPQLVNSAIRRFNRQ